MRRKSVPSLWRERLWATRTSNGLVSEGHSDLAPGGSGIAQNGQDRQISTVMSPEKTAWEPLRPENCQGKNSKQKSVLASAGGPVNLSERLANNPIEGLGKWAGAVGP
jgi:hypothetical protein